MNTIREATFDLSPPGACADGPPADAWADRRLVDRCRAGEIAAWEQLYHQCHGPLVLAIKVFLGRYSAGDDLAEEIAARVWLNLVDDQGALLDRFDAERGCRLTTFLAALAKRDVLRYLRSERRRHARENASRPNVGSQRALPPPPDADFSVALDEFLDTLSLREREFCEAYLLANAVRAADDYSATNRWQLCHRVRRKLLDFLGDD